MNTTLNIILFGQTGSGKSSVVNMIAGREIAPVSNGAAGCTLSFKPYVFPVTGRKYRVWDTVGLDEADMELVSIEQAIELIHDLTSQGGVDLLLFCIRAPRITAASQANYRLFYEVLCRSQVPVAFIITHLEQEPIMEGWWVRNEARLDILGLKSAGHACVTTLPTHSKFRESQASIARLLVGYNGNGSFIMPEEGWTIEFLRSLGLFSSLKRESKRKEIIRVLVRRCRMNPTVAEEIADKLEDWT